MVPRVMTKGATKGEEGFGYERGRKLTATRVVTAIRTRQLRLVESRLG
jgi:hypothetical protein